MLLRIGTRKVIKVKYTMGMKEIKELGEGD
jgi:hypothetical protein